MIVKGFPSVINGKVEAPQSKSIGIRLIFFSLLTDIELENLVLSEDVKSALNAVKSLGVSVEFEGNKVKLQRKGNEEIKEVYVGGSGTTLRFLLPIAAILGKRLSIDGDETLRRRPISAFLRAVKGVSISSEKLPLTIEGRLDVNNISIDGSESSQYISGFIIGFCMIGEGRISIIPPISSKSYILLTINLLNSLGAKIKFYESENIIEIRCGKINKYAGRVPGDYALSSYYALSSLFTGGKLRISNLYAPYDFFGDHSIVEIYHKMGAISYYKEGEWVIESKNEYYNINIDVDDAPDLAPSIAPLSAIALGESKITGVRRLRIKESDRILTISETLRAFGVKVKEGNNELIIIGSKELHSGSIICPKDHRIAMMATPFILKLGGTIGEAECVNKSNPNFWIDIKKIGGRIEIV
ncbi:MAG: 3-phosphoshikimate 1-carboxyvinyltransferase [Sulfolobaceae archaeon]